MKVLVLIGNFYPKPSSVANCAKPLLSALEDQSSGIDIVTNSPLKKGEIVKISSKTSVYCFPDKYSYYIHRINGYFDGKRKNIIYRNIRQFIKIPLFLRYQVFSKERKMGGWSIGRSIKQYKKLSKAEPYDLILSFSQPFTAHIIARKIKAISNIPWIAYQYDPYSHNPSFIQTSSLHKYKIKKQEYKVFTSANRIILTRELYDYYQHTDLVSFKEKFTYLDYILFENRGPTVDNVVKGAGLTLAYGGGFYTSIRNPMHMLKVMGNLRLEFIFFFLTNYNEPRFNAFFKNNSNFKILSQSNHEAAISVLNMADILISVGNTTEIQVPAKIFEYMGIGKPIIHFSKTHNDPAIKYLEQYPLSLIIKESEGTVHSQTADITTFIKNSRRKKLSYKEVVSFLPNHDFSYIYGQFISIIDSELPRKSKAR